MKWVGKGSFFICLHVDIALNFYGNRADTPLTPQNLCGLFMRWFLSAIIEFCLFNAVLEAGFRGQF